MSKEILLVILLMTVVTYGARAIPFFLFRKMKITGLWKNFITLVPVALLAALVLPELVIPPEETGFKLWNPYLFAGICTFIFASRVSNLFYSILFGMIVFWGFDKII